MIRGSLGLLLGGAGLWLVLLLLPAAAISVASAFGGDPPFLAASFARSTLSRSRPIIGPLFDVSLFSSCCARPRFRACMRTQSHATPSRQDALFFTRAMQLLAAAGNSTMATTWMDDHEAVGCCGPTK